MAAVAAPEDESSPAGGISVISLGRIDPSAFQPRDPIDETSLAELTASIRSRGLLQPILVRPHPETDGRFEIIAGERRWRAAQLAGLSEVPALVRPLTPMEAMAAALVENLQRQDLNAIEEADGYRRLQEDFGLTQEELAEAVGKSRSHVANTTRLLRLPSSVQGDVRRGALSAGHARALLAHYDPESAAQTVIARGLNVRQTEQLITTPRARRTTVRRSAHSNPDTAALEQQLMGHLGLKVEIVATGLGGTVRLHYSSLEQLEGLVALLLR